MQSFGMNLSVQKRESAIFGPSGFFGMATNKERDYDTVEPSEEWLARGKEFGHWFRLAIKNSENINNVAQLANVMGVVRQTLYPYAKDCIAGDGRFRRPSQGMIRAIASATGADPESGIAAMYGKAAAVKNAGMMRHISPDAVEVLDDYEGLPEDGRWRQEAREALRRLNRLADEAYKNRTDIIGKRLLHNNEDGFERIPNEDE